MQTGHIIELELPEFVHESLTRKAIISGVSTEVLASRLLVAAAKDLNSDPLEKFIGAFDSEGSDWADQHDSYIGRAALSPANDEEGDIYSDG